MKLSVVTTMYRSADYLPDFVSRTDAVCRKLGGDYEILLVNDGSPDDSLQVALSLRDRYDRVAVVDLSRNFGHHHAFMAGLAGARGERVFFIDCDLEESPEWLDTFTARLDETGADVVFGVQASRKGPACKRWAGALFYRLFNLISETSILPNPCTVRLMTRRYADALLTLKDRALFLAGNYAWAGFDQVACEVEKQPRQGTTYGLARSVGLFVTAVTSFSAYPLSLVFLAGCVISGLAGAAGLALLTRKLLHPEMVLLGYASIMVTMWFLGGLTILFLGIIGLYLARIFAEVKPRPCFIVRRTYGRKCEHP